MDLWCLASSSHFNDGNNKSKKKKHGSLAWSGFQYPPRKCLTWTPNNVLKWLASKSFNGAASTKQENQAERRANRCVEKPCDIELEVHLGNLGKTRHSFDIVWHSICHSFWHSIWHIFWYFIWRLFWLYLACTLTFYIGILSCTCILIYSDILSDMLYDILSGIYIYVYQNILLYLTSFLVFYLTYILAFFLTFYLAFYSASFWHSIWHRFWHSTVSIFYLAYFLTIFLAFYLASAPTFFLVFYLAFLLTFFCHSFWHVFWVHAQTIAISFWSESAPLELIVAVTSGSVGAHSDELADRRRTRWRGEGGKFTFNC